MIVDLDRFVQQEEPYWQALDAALTRQETDRAYRPPLDEALKLFELYERCAADLARLEEALQPELADYLGSIVARAYSQIHSAHRRARFRPLEWLWVTLPRTFRRQRRAFALTVLLTVLGTAAGGGLMAIDPDAKATLMPFQGLLSDPVRRVQHEEQQRGRELQGEQAQFAASLMTHNIRVALFALACGMTFGIGTILLLFGNGVMLGAVGFDYIHAGEAKFLFGWLLPHGVIEIPALLIASQAGLVLASALIGWNSSQRRADRLRAAANDVFTLALGATLLLGWAGLVESYISQYHEPVLPYSAKIAFGLVELVLLTWYLGRAGSAAGKSGGEASA